MSEQRLLSVLVFYGRSQSCRREPEHIKARVHCLIYLVRIYETSFGDAMDNLIEEESDSEEFTTYG